MAKRVHELKTFPAQFEQVEERKKRFDLRKNDRDFREGDELILREWSSRTGYSGKHVRVRVTLVIQGDVWGLEKGYCCMSIDIIDEAQGRDGSVELVRRPNNYLVQSQVSDDIFAAPGPPRTAGICTQSTVPELVDLPIGVPGVAVSRCGNPIGEHTTFTTPLTIREPAVGRTWARLPQPAPIRCASCPEARLAACIGLYEASSDEHPVEPACDDCCGHGCEDGHCDKLSAEVWDMDRLNALGDDEFLDYVTTQSRTERAVFSAAETKRLYDLADEGLAGFSAEAFYCIRPPAADVVVARARQMLVERRAGQHGGVSASRGRVQGSE